MSRVPIITVDGPSGVGKGTLCARLAEHYGFHFLDSGALYRVLALISVQRGLSPSDEAPLLTLARQLPVRFEQGQIWLLPDQEITDLIRTEQVAALASQLAAVPAIRSALLAFQREFAKPPGLVADGRDMGTVVFADAPAKLFLDASAQVRAERRAKQLKNQGLSANIDNILQEIRARDERDRNRSVAPLRPAEDALVIDTSYLLPEEVFQQACAWIEVRLANRMPDRF